LENKLVLSPVMNTTTAWDFRSSRSTWWV